MARPQKTRAPETMSPHRSASNSPYSTSRFSMTVAFKDPTIEKRGAYETPVTASKSTIGIKTATDTQAPAGSGMHGPDAAGVGTGEDDDANDPEDGTGHVFAPSVRLENSLLDPRATSAGTMFSNVDELTGLSGDKNAVDLDEKESAIVGISSPRRPSCSNFTESSGAMSDVDFDVADDDDDYGAIDQMSQCSDNDANIEALDTAHLASNVNDWANQTSAYKSTEGEDYVDWNDERTYDFEYPFPDIDPFGDVNTDPTTLSPLMDDVALRGGAGPSSTPPAPMDCDPHIGPDLFARDLSDVSSLSSSSTNASGPKVQEPEVPVSQAAASQADESDTECEDLSEEIQRRLQILQKRKRRESVKQKRRSKNKSKDLTNPSSASKIKKFARSPKRVQAHARLTARGRIVCLTFTEHTRIRWMTGRVPVDPSEIPVASPELTRSVRSRMFQQTYCPDQASVEAIRQLFSPFDPESPILSFAQPSPPQARLIEPPPQTFGSNTGLPRFSEDMNTVDFSQFMDDDGTPGLTIYQDYLDFSEDDDDVSDTTSGRNTQSQRISELDEQMDDGSISVSSPTSPAAQEVAPDMDADTPCPKRVRIDNGIIA